LTFEVLWLLVWLAQGPVGGEGAVFDLRLLALSPASESAVVEVDEEEAGALHLVHPGESIGATGLRVVRVLPDRVEAELTTPAEPGAPPVRRRLWIYRAKGTAPSRVQLFDRVPPAPERVRSSSSGESP